MSMNQIPIIIVNLKYSSKRLSRDSDKPFTGYLPLCFLTEMDLRASSEVKNSSSLRSSYCSEEVIRDLKDESLGGSFLALY